MNQVHHASYTQPSIKAKTEGKERLETAAVHSIRVRIRINFNSIEWRSESSKAR